MNQHFLFSNTILKYPLTSIETSIFKRNKIFKEYLNINPIYICTEFDLKQQGYVKELKKAGVIPEDFKLVNLYDFFLSDCDVYRKPSSEIKDKVIYNEGKKRLSRIYDPETNKLAFVSFYDDEERLYRVDKYDYDGYLFGSFFITPQNEYQMIHFYRRDGSLAITIQYGEQAGKNEIIHIVVFDKNGLPYVNFKNKESLHLYLFRYYLSHFSHNDQVNIILDREEFLFNKLYGREISANVKCFVLLHSNHNNTKLDNNEYSGAPNVLLGSEKSDGVIALTPQQAKDIQNTHGDQTQVFYIPHPVDQQEHSPYSERLHNRVIAVGRLSIEKQHNKMVRIFAKVVEKIPDAQLDIFGSGKLKEKLEEQIKSLNLQNNVHLKGFTNNIAQEYRTAQCSLLTSALEGQPLVILESLSFGCPVISSNIKYGPADMIENGKNGFLLAEDDEELFAERIINVLKNQQLAEWLSKNAYASVERFSEQNIAPLWKKWVEDITS